MLLASLMACESAAPGEAVAPRADEYAGSAGMILVFAPADAPEDVPLQLRIAEGAWEARIGSDWDEGEPAGSWSVNVGTTIEVGGVALLEPPLPPPTELEVRYGTFPEVIESSVKGGEFAGEWAFARDVGPILSTLGGVRRECIFYWRDEETG
jgi:hypothetical protein